MQTPVNITGGPLSYRYRFHEIHIHYGLHDQFGSEHSVDGYTFPAEVSPLRFYESNTIHIQGKPLLFAQSKQIAGLLSDFCIYVVVFVAFLFEKFNFHKTKQRNHLFVHVCNIVR